MVVLLKRMRIAPIVSLDSLCNIMEFCKVRERRQMSCVSRDFSQAFDRSRLRCAMIAMAIIATERKRRFYFYIIRSPSEPLEDVLPVGLRRHQMTEYVNYQIDAMFKRYYVKGMDVNAFYDVIDNSFHMTDLFKIGAVLKLIQAFVTHTPYEEIDVRFFFTFSTGDHYDQLLECLEENAEDNFLDILWYTGELCNSNGKTYLCSFQRDVWIERGQLRLKECNSKLSK